VQANRPRANENTLEWSSPGITGVWAEENTRNAIFAALKRKETFATSGTRIRVRMFGGWNFDPKMTDSGDWVSKAYAEGVAMGSDLPAKPVSASAPTFVFQAVKDPEGANLDRIQVIKLWLDGSGYKEKLFDVALSSNRKDDPETGRAVPVGNTVNLKTGTYRNTIGAAVLTAVWQDPEFDPTKLPSTMRARWRFRRRAGARSSPSKTICQFQRVCRQLFRNAPGRHPSGSRRPVNPRVNDTRIGRGILHGRS
jgi:hypothetical protein